ncbi:MAG: hypothetical protein HYX28_05975 [Candidatus Koribacter versatilis]|uniref:Adhesin domain-containing protein n=1 Tax=Candidatus Korobacter versatilis TaxID=658062 RepID=A0A932A9V7_9BACT|nr:hypothetical protein [Candidatus Koribacter versatilis]
MKRFIQIGAVVVLGSVLGSACVLADVRGDVGRGDVGASGETPAGSSSSVYRQGNTWVQEIKGTLGNAKVIKVSTDAGSVRVTGSDRGDIAYTLRKKVYSGTEETARKRFEQFKISAWTVGETATFRGSCESQNGRTSADFDIQAPRSVTVVYVRTDGGGVAVSNIAGRADLQTEGGSIEMDKIGSSIVAETSGGPINVGSAGADVKVDTSGGSITIRSANGMVRADTSGGSIEVGTIKAAAILNTAGGSIRAQEIGGNLEAETAGGNLDIGDVWGTAKLSTAGGSIRLNSASGRVDADSAGGSIRLMQLKAGARAQTAAGSIYVEFIGPRSAFSESRLETTAGDIIVMLPSNLGVNVRAGIEMATGHRIRSDFAELKITSEGGEYPGGPREIFAEGALNGGGPLLKAQTTIGNIEFRKRK